MIEEYCNARIGFMGNPSDGFQGKTLSFLIDNFYTVVRLVENSSIVIAPHPIHDPGNYTGLEHLLQKSAIQGYYGGQRILLATCKVFTSYCESCGLMSKISSGFEMSYDTNIPRMVGLSGSSALVVAAFRALLRFYNLSLEDLKIEKHVFPQVILNIEVLELGISGGLQDRVIQTYGGLVHMDFTKETLEKGEGIGCYTPLDVALIPEMYLAYNTNAGGDSGKVHSTVRERWNTKDAQLIAGMTELGTLADDAVRCLQQKDFVTLATLIDRNFALRRKLYGDDVVGRKNIMLAELASNEFNLASKFTGSGGAFLMMKRDGTGWMSESEELTVRQRLLQEGFEFIRIRVGQK